MLFQPFDNLDPHLKVNTNMSSDPVFEGCGSAVGIESWRVENLGLKKLDKGTVIKTPILFAM